MFTWGRRVVAVVATWMLICSAPLDCLCAQARVTTAGRVLAVDGSPLPGAVVRFVGSVPPLCDRFDPADYREVAADERGRFKVRLLANGDYSAWAVGPAAADGSCLVSELRDIQPGTGFEVQVRDTCEVHRMAVTGAEEWPDVGPLRFEVGLATNTVHRQAVTVVDGFVTMPPRPRGVGYMVFVRDREGELLFAESLRKKDPKREFVVPHPQAARVRVVDEAGNGIAGATIRIEAGEDLWGGRPNALGGHRRLAEWREVAQTDAAGEAVVLVPTRDDWRRYPSGFSMMVASKRGYRASFSGFFGGVVIDGKASAKLPIDGVLPFTLVKAEGFVGRVTGHDGRPAKDTPIEVSAQILLPISKTAFQKYETCFRTTCGEDGTFRFDHLPKEFTNVLVHVGTPVGGVTVPRRAPAFLKPDLTKAFSIDFRALPVIDLRVVDGKGLPARNAHVLLLPVPIGKRKLDASTHVLRLDNHGRASVQVQQGSWQVMATDRVGLAWNVFDVTKNLAITLDLVPLQQIRGVVEMDAGTRRTDIRLGIDMENRFANPAEDFGVVSSIGAELNRWLLGCTEFADDGTFAMRFAKVADTQYGVYIRVGTQRQSFPLTVRSDLKLHLRTN